jgi:uncharacterized protein (UPF0332 family)
MKPETLAFLAAADRSLDNARRVLAIDIADQAARLAYYAQFHAAQALIFEQTGKVAKTHKGVDRQFHKLIRVHQNAPADLAAKLSASYYFKDIADYDASGTTSITAHQAIDVIAIAEAFVAEIRRALS